MKLSSHKPILHAPNAGLTADGSTRIEQRKDNGTLRTHPTATLARSYLAQDLRPTREQKAETVSQPRKDVAKHTKDLH